MRLTHSERRIVR